jgi:peptide/nickel transport system substrate-binding protein
LKTSGDDMGRGWAASAAVAVALASLDACSAAAPVRPGVITIAVFASPNNLDPRIGTDEISQKIGQLIYDNLLTLDDRLRIAPGLAERWEQLDPTTYLVYLRRGVRFHDGHELTSADVVHTFGSLLDPSFVSPRKGAYRLLDSVTAIDEHTVRFVLKEPFGSFLIQLVMPVVPEGAGPELATHPIGTGPYRFQRFAVDDRVELTRFDQYFAGPPRNAGVVLRIVPDEVMRSLELRKGAVDLIVNDVSPDVVHTLRKTGEAQVFEAPGSDYAYLGFNLRDPVLADVRVRQAIGYAIDRQAIVDHLRRGLARPAVGVVPPMSWAFEPDVFEFRHDPARAQRLLDEAGYRDPDRDGPDPRMRLTLKTSTNEFYRLQAAVLQEQLRHVGIALDVRSYEFATLYADVLQGHFQLFTLQWVGVSDPDMLRRVFHSAQVPPVGFNRGYYANAEVDRLIDLATKATDDAARERWYRDAQRLVARDAPYISLWYKTNVAVARPGVAGVVLSPTADFSFLKNVTKGLMPEPLRDSIEGRP